MEQPYYPSGLSPRNAVARCSAWKYSSPFEMHGCALAFEVLDHGFWNTSFGHESTTLEPELSCGARRRYGGIAARGDDEMRIAAFGVFDVPHKVGDAAIFERLGWLHSLYSRACAHSDVAQTTKRR